MDNPTCRCGGKQPLTKAQYFEWIAFFIMLGLVLLIAVPAVIGLF